MMTQNHRINPGPTPTDNLITFAIDMVAKFHAQFEYKIAWQVMRLLGAKFFTAFFMINVNSYFMLDALHCTPICTRWRA